MEKELKSYTLGTFLLSKMSLNVIIRPVNLHPLFLKIGHPAFRKKQSAKNQGHCNSKREEAAWFLLFLNKE